MTRYWLPETVRRAERIVAASKEVDDTVNDFFVFLANVVDGDFEAAAYFHHFVIDWPVDLHEDWSRR